MGGLNPQQALSLYASDNPFQSASAYRTSNYSAYLDGTLFRLLDWREPTGQAKMTHQLFRSFVTNDRFACVGAKGAVMSGGYRFALYDRFPSPNASEGLARDLAAFVAELPHIAAKYKTFVAVFNDTTIAGEADFEERLWRQLDVLHAADVRHFDWNPSVSRDPADARFAFSAAGHPFFVIGMHPQASRLSRRFALPALVFNSHEQFRELKSSGHYARIREQVRARELELQGSLNPNLSDHGDCSEAGQYAGRAVEDEWICPFHPASSV